MKVFSLLANAILTGFSQPTFDATLTWPLIPYIAFVSTSTTSFTSVLHEIEESSL